MSADGTAAAAGAPGVTLQRTSFADFVSPTEELIHEARRGRTFVLVDDEDREK